jgi:hypothetical protein
MPEELPLLFGKWKPDEFYDFSIKDIAGYLNQRYIFSFAHVEIESTDVHFPVRKIHAQSMTPPSLYTPDGLFEPFILEMYHDALNYVSNDLQELSESIHSLRSIVLAEHSAFARRTGLHFTVDYQKIAGGFENVAERNRIVGEIYGSLESDLVRQFGSASQEIEPNYLLWIQSGERKIISFGNGTLFTAESPIEDEVNAGTMYLGVCSDETAVKENHAAVVDYCIHHITDNFKKLLRNNDGKCVHIGTSGDGSEWLIDLSNIGIPKQFMAQNFAGILPEYKEHKDE